MDTSISSDTRNAEQSQELLGVWKLQDWIYTNLNTGGITHPFGVTPYGFITFGEDGQYFESVVKSIDAPVLASDNANRLKIAQDHHVLALDGTWQLIEGKLSVEVLNSLSENIQGTLLVRDIFIGQSEISLSYKWQSENNTRMCSTSNLMRWQPGSDDGFKYHDQSSAYS